MAISIVAAYSSGDSAFDVSSTATSSSACTDGSRNSTTLVPNSDWGASARGQSAGALSENRPRGSRQATSPAATPGPPAGAAVLTPAGGTAEVAAPAGGTAGVAG